MNDRPGFWRRQFFLPPTSRQTVSDVLFGIVLPLGCLAGDRLIFGQSDFFTGSIFREYAVLAYSFILTEIALLALWILLRRKLRRSAAYFSGPLLAGWLFALLVGTLLLPLSIVGLILVIGLLGFSPWLTFFAFFRNWRMARELSRDYVSGRRRTLLTLAGIVFAITPALALQRYADRQAAMAWRAEGASAGHGVDGANDAGRFVPEEAR